MEPTVVLPIVVPFLLVTVEWGGWALLRLITGGEGVTGWRLSFFRAGHAHAGVLNILALVYLVYLPQAGFSDDLEWALGGVLLAGILAQAGGFFVHLSTGQQGQPSMGTTLTRVGAVLIAIALVGLAVGLIGTA